MFQQDFTNGRYNKIPDEIRDRLVEMVVVYGLTIKEGSKVLRIKYSTAKTIFKIYNKEHRTAKLKTRCRNPENGSSAKASRIMRAQVPTFLLKIQNGNHNLVCGTLPKNGTNVHNQSTGQAHTQRCDTRQLTPVQQNCQFSQALISPLCKKNMSQLSDIIYQPWTTGDTQRRICPTNGIGCPTNGTGCQKEIIREGFAPDFTYYREQIEKSAIKRASVIMQHRRQTKNALKYVSPPV